MLLCYNFVEYIKIGRELVGKKRRWLPVFLSLLVLAAFLIGVAASIWDYADVDEKQHADVIIVLGAATAGDAPSPVFRERINHGIWLYENGYADFLIFTGGKGDGEKISEAEAAKNYGVLNGVPESAIYIETLSTITEENMENAKAIMEAQGFETAIIVSDPLHMKRAMVMAEDYGITAFASPTPTTMYRSLETKLPFLLRESVLYIGYEVVGLFR